MRPERTVMVPAVRSARRPPVTFRSVSRWSRPKVPSRTRKSSLVTRRSTLADLPLGQGHAGAARDLQRMAVLVGHREATHVDEVRLQTDVGVDGREARPFVGQAERAVGDAQAAVEGRRRQRPGQVQVGVQRAGDLLDQRREHLRHAQVDGARLDVEIDGRGVAPRVVAQHGRRGQCASDRQPLGAAIEPGLHARRLGIVAHRGVERLVGEVADLAVADREVRGRVRRQQIPDAVAVPFTMPPSPRPVFARRSTAARSTSVKAICSGRSAGTARAVASPMATDPAASIFCDPLARARRSTSTRSPA